MDIAKGIALCGIFIGSFYVWRRERLFAKTAIHDLQKAALDPDIYVDRNSTTTIRRRVVSFAAVSGASAAYLLWSRLTSTDAPSPTTESALRELRLGCKSLFATLSLFAGPLVEEYMEGCLPSLHTYWSEEPLRFTRDLIICPIGEELFFRGVLFDVVRSRSLTAQVVVTSLLFALAHVHHIFSFAADAYRDADTEHDDCEDGECTQSPPPLGPSNDTATARAWRVAWRRVTVMTAVTFTFGLLSGLYYTRACERSLLATIVAHVTCNAIGAPRFSFLQSNANDTMNGRKKWVAVAYVLGVIGSITVMA